MRVLIGANVPGASGGGIRSHVLAIADYLEDLGVEVELVWALPKAQWARGALTHVRFGRHLDRIARSGRFDVVHSHGADAAMLSPQGPVRVVTSHGDEAEGFRVRLASERVPIKSRVLAPLTRLPLWRRAFRRAEAAIALHDEDAAKLRSYRAAPPETVYVIPNGCGPVRAATPEPGHVVFLGNWLERKGAHLTPRIFRAIRTRAPYARLTLIGPPTESTLAFALDDRPSVATRGFVDEAEVQTTLATADVLLLPSFFEGMPLAALECLAFGVPTVGFGIPGTAAAVGDSGVLTPVGDADRLGFAVADLIGDRDRREALADRARKRAAELSWAKVAGLTLDVYETALEARLRGDAGARVPR
jgi:glycosyltransferase involved in cell wall biosynthesis